MNRIMIVCLACVCLWCSGFKECGYPEPDQNFCKPGTYRDCYCDDGSSGIQYCGENGKYWLDCDCLNAYEDALIDSGPDADNDTDNDDDADDDADDDGEKLIWALHAGGTGEDRGYDMAVTSDGTICITGFFHGQAAFGKDADGEKYLQSAGARDMFLSCYSSEGDLLWASRAGGTGKDFGMALVAPDDESLLVTGKFADTAIFGEGVDSVSLTEIGANDDVFIARYSTGGTLDWVRQTGGSATAHGWDIAVNEDGHYAVTGSFSETAVFGMGEDNETMLVPNGEHDVFTAKFNAQGELQWAKSIGGPEDDRGWDVEIAADGSVYVTGYIAGDGVFTSDAPEETVHNAGGLSDIFIGMYEPDGTLAWIRCTGSADDFERIDESGRDIIVLEDSSAIFSGFFWSTARFSGNGNEEIELTSYGQRDTFLVRYFQNGTLDWALHAGGGMSESAACLHSAGSGEFFTGGYFEDVAVFGKGGENETTLCSEGEQDAFFAMYDNDGSLIWARRTGGGGSEYVQDIDPAPDNTIVISGFHTGNSVFGKGEGNETKIKSYGDYDIFLARFGR